MAVDAHGPARGIEAEALEWVRRIDDPEFADWDAHMAWLERSPAHAAAFDRVASAIADAVGAVPPRDEPFQDHRLAEHANDNAPTPGRAAARWWLGGVAAVAATALAIVTTTLGRESTERLVRTEPGEVRTLSLADGTTIVLNGATGIRLAGTDTRDVTLDAGQAFFRVRHDAERPFAVRIGDDVVRDVGTTFDIALTPAGANVAVGEGEAVYEAGSDSIRLPAGRRLVVYKGSAAVSTVDPSSVGGWRNGRLVYRDATLADVAADLSRAVGEPVTAGPDARIARFTGVIVLDRDRRTTFDRVQAATGYRAEHGAGGWRLVAPTR